MRVSMVMRRPGLFSASSCILSPKLRDGDAAGCGAGRKAFAPFDGGIFERSEGFDGLTEFSEQGDEVFTRRSDGVCTGPPRIGIVR